MHDPRVDFECNLTRRQFFSRSVRGVAGGVGSAALAGLLAEDGLAGPTGALANRHFAPKAKRVIYLFMSGAPSQIDMWDPKPGLADRFDEELPESIRMGQRLTTMTSGQTRFPTAPSLFQFQRAGASGCEISELLPWTAKVVDKMSVIRSVHTEAINHDPAITFMQTGHQQPGRPSLGAWLSYGLGSPNKELPSFVVLHSTWNGRPEAQALFQRLWGSGFLPSEHQGVALRSSGDPVLYLKDPPGIERSDRRRMLDRVAALNRHLHDEIGDPETMARIQQYEMAYRMQTSVPELVELDNETQETFDLYGPDARTPGTFARNCMLARRMAERGVPCIQIYIRGWDHHGGLPKDIRGSCRDIDQPCYALLTDLERRGMLDDTLVVWGGEFGRTVYCQGALTREDYGRDHHPRCWTMWMAGGGVKAGFQYGKTDDFSYNITENPVHVHDLNATILHLMGIDHEKLTFRHQGRDFRLTDVHGRVVHDLIA